MIGRRDAAWLALAMAMVIAALGAMLVLADAELASIAVRNSEQGVGALGP